MTETEQTFTCSTEELHTLLRLADIEIQPDAAATNPLDAAVVGRLIAHGLAEKVDDIVRLSETADTAISIAVSPSCALAGEHTLSSHRHRFAYYAAGQLVVEHEVEADDHRIALLQIDELRVRIAERLDVRATAGDAERARAVLSRDELMSSSEAIPFDDVDSCFAFSAARRRENALEAVDLRLIESSNSGLWSLEPGQPGTSTLALLPTDRETVLTALLAIFEDGDA